MELFQSINPPNKQGTLPINGYGLWYTWSRDFRDFIKSEKDTFTSFGAPFLVDIDKNKKTQSAVRYRKSFTVSLYEKHKDNCQYCIEFFSQSLANINVENNIRH
uniref:Uncharacterized protein n=1 Tax=Candidatus Kentrum sp. LPFa TaxID=2126335 RepID=A0A450XH89_9GAMM|nr:MAG: hypothetical protein BECKLPF1236A_GA0070988_103094 [Candidatus Kentron sp. LPFa]VFK28636.1 MAG: hypothetical protein BECKLPF1236C_GA0070990_1007011 [Candidatus Kentron sp. LPFa]